MTDATALDILLHDRRIGTLARLDGDCSIFTFDEVHLADPLRTGTLGPMAPSAFYDNASANVDNLSARWLSPG